MGKPHHRTLCTLLALIWAVPAAAQVSEEEELALVYGDKDTVSIATGSQQDLRRAPAVASVITAEDIAAMGATDLDEALESVPGLHVAHSAIAYAPLNIIRGIYSANNPQTLMLQNGIPTTTMFTGGKGNVWGGLPLENVARIEIIRGPGSALYGADAYAGVINIITKTAADTPGTRFGFRAGSFNTQDAWVQHGGKFGAVDVAAYFRVGSTDGFKQTITADAQTAKDLISHTSASLAPGPINIGHDAVDGNLDLSYQKWRARMSYKLRDNVGSGAGVASALDPVGEGKSERITADLSWADPLLTRDWGMGFTASYLQYNDTTPINYDLYPPGTKFGANVFPNGVIGAPNKWERDIRLSAFATYSGFQGHQLRFGVGHDDLDLYKTSNYKNYQIINTAPFFVPTGPVIDYSSIQPFMLPQRRKVDYFYVQDEWNFAKDWTLTAGVRHDDFSDFGGTTNPRLALVWDVSLDLTAKLLYGHAFRAPAFVEEYSINNPVQQGNPNLRPETMRSTEAAFSWQARKDTRVNVNFFRYDLNDIIRAVANPSGVGSTYNNAGGQHGSGMELEAVWDYSQRLRFTGNYSYQKSIDETTNQDAGYAPHNHVYLRTDWRYPSGWFASAQLNYVGDRKRAPGDTRPQVPDYTTVDLTVRSPTRDHWDFSGSVRNLFNSTVLEPSLYGTPTAIPNDLPMAPRSVWFQAVYKL